MCGCGERTQLAPQTRAARGWIRGQPKRYAGNHRKGNARSFAATVEAMLARREITDGGCWIWMGATRSTGYGVIGFGGELHSVHRVSAAAFLGFDLHDNAWICHHCDTPPCFNPAHLYIGSPATNTRDALLRGRLHRRLSDDAIRTIRRRYADGETVSALAREFGVTRRTITCTATRVWWKHVE